MADGAPFSATASASMADPNAALDPEQSVIVEACAGSGKTWLLVSRLLRILLTGTAPGRILAITYTRKAAREIESRLDEWLRFLARAPDDDVLRFLAERGLAPGEARARLGDARCLYQQVLAADPPLAVHTFHAWFAKLLRHAPMDSGYAGLTLAASSGRLRELAWMRLCRDAARQPQGERARALARLFEEFDRDELQALLAAFAERRAEWHIFRARQGGVDGLVAALAAEWGFESSFALGSRADELSGDGPACAALAQDPAHRRALAEFAELLERADAGTSTMAGHLATLRAGLSLAALPPETATVFLTAQQTVRQFRLNARARKQLGDESHARLLCLHAELAERHLAAMRRDEDLRALRGQAAALRVGDAYLEYLLAALRAHRQMDFADLEAGILELLSDAARGPLMQARLDARYRQVLLDEFQDTNPLQWRILEVWFENYAPRDDAPRLFLVGDPKQAIYRFRRADARLFAHARTQWRQRFDARYLTQDQTRRNAPAIIDVVNALFGERPDFPDFRTHHSLVASLPGRVELLARRPPPPPSQVAADRDWLEDPLLEDDDTRRNDEARALIARLQAIIGTTLLTEYDAAGRTCHRRAQWGDVLILLRRRTHAHHYERALREAGIPYFAATRGGLLEALEVRDLIALLEALVNPANDLALAHALRSPLFALSEATLFRLSAQRSPCAGDGNTSWWARLGTIEDADCQRAARLLERWRTLAGHLPVHDLLDRIHHEGELLGRYRGAVGPERWPAVRANLDALLALALELDAGRYPSLPRFIAEIGRLKLADDDEAPDAGRIDAAEAMAGHVELMTIHAAKGLERAIVCLVDSHATRGARPRPQVLIDWPPASASPRHFSLRDPRLAEGHARAALFAAEAEGEAREALNLFYVAVTRARQMLIVSGVDSNQKSSQSSWHEQIEAALDHLGAPPAQDGLRSWQRGDFPAMDADTVQGAQGAPMPAPLPAPAEAEGQVLATVGQLRPERRNARDTEGQRYGRHWHAVLDALTSARAPQRPAGLPSASWQALRARAQALIAHPELAMFFSAEQYAAAHNEVEFALPDGTIGRIDRLVEHADALWVLDYKTGAPDTVALDTYAAQLTRYRQALAQIRPDKPIRAALLLDDATLLEWADGRFKCHQPGPHHPFL